MNAAVWLKPLEGHPIVNSSAKNAFNQNLFALDRGWDTGGGGGGG